MIPSLISDDPQVSGPFCRYLVRVMLSALGGGSMRGIERVLAALLLIGAVGGAAVFASHSGSSPADAVRLAAPPEQHLSGPGAVLIAPTPADRRQGLHVVKATPALVSIAGIGHAGAVALIEPFKQTVRLRPIVPLVPAPSPVASLSPALVPVPAPATPVQAPPAVPGPVVTAAPETPRAPAAADPVPTPPVAPTTPTPPIEATPVPVETLPDPPPDLHGLGLAPGPQPTPVDAPAQGQP